MSELKTLYQEVILDHNKHPNNFRKIENADREVEGYNPFCGDHYTLYLKLKGDKIDDISFTGSGCAISKASASVMTTVLKGKTMEDARRLFETFHQLVTGHHDGSMDDLGKLAVFSGVSEFPARVKCAILAWHTVQSALNSKQTATTVTTE